MLIYAATRFCAFNSQSHSTVIRSLAVLVFQMTMSSSPQPDADSSGVSYSTCAESYSISFDNPVYTEGASVGTAAPAATMSDPYKEFDKSDTSPIVPEIRIKNYSFRVREVIIGSIAIVAVICCFGLIAALATKKSPTTNGPLTPQQASQQAARAFCLDPPCLKTAAYAVANMNTSVKPCDDFFQYACGKFPTLNPLDPDVKQRTVYYNMYYENQDKLRSLLKSAPKRDTVWSAEKKLKDFYKSCLDDYGKAVAAGKSFIDKIIRPLGGWYVLDTFQEDSFNIQNAVEKTNIDFWTAALFTFRVATDRFDPTKRVIEIDFAGMGMRWWYYISPGTQQIRNDYKKFMRTVAQHLAEDSGLSLDPANLTSKIETFVADAYDVEYQMANITYNTLPSEDPHNHTNRISLGDLTVQTGNVVDFVSFFQHMFGTDLVNSGTRIVHRERIWLNLVLRMVKNFPEGDKKRKLSNYFIWRLARRYAQELSWNYLHAIRQFYNDVWGYKNFYGTWEHCFWHAKYDMGDALGALYAKQHFNDGNKAKAEEMVTYVKQELLDSLETNTFMDDATKQRAKDKLNAARDKIGYPDVYLQDSEVDSIYQAVSINRSDYFDNLLNLNLFEKQYWKRRLQHGEDRSRWRYNSFETFMWYSQAWNELMIPAGLLQFPVYDWTLPHYYNFGAIGSLIGHYFVHTVDRWGSRYLPNGTYTQSWYTQASATAYRPFEECYADAFSNKTMGPYKVVGQAVPQTVPVKGHRYAWEGLAETSGVKLAYKAYQKWIKDKGNEKLTPTPHYTNDQSFFLAFAQTRCFVRSDAWAYNYAMGGRVSEDIRTNTELSLLDEFSSAFGCSAKSRMNSKTKCDTF